MSPNSPFRDPLETSSALLGRVFPELTVPTADCFESADAPEFVGKWKRILHNRLLQTCARALETARPFTYELERNDDAQRATAEAFDMEQKRVHAHEEAEPALPAGNQKIAASRMKAWEAEHERWEKERATIVASLVRRHGEMFAAIREPKQVKPEDTMDIVTLARAETQIAADIVNIRAKLRETDEAMRAYRADHMLREALQILAGEDVELMEAVTETVTRKDTEPPKKKKKKNGGKSSKTAAKTRKIFTSEGKTGAPDYYFQTMAAPEYDPSPFLETLVTARSQIRPLHGNEPSKILINVRLSHGKTMSIPIDIRMDKLVIVDVPHESDVSEKMRALRQAMLLHKRELDALDSKNFMTEVSNASESFAKIMDICDLLKDAAKITDALTDTEGADETKRYKAIIATVESTIPETMEDIDATVQVNIMKQMLLSVLAQEGSEERSLGEFFRAEKMPMIGNLTMKVGADEKKPITREEAISLRPFFERIEQDKREEKRFLASILKATSLYEATMEQREEDTLSHMSTYLESIDPLAATFIRNVGGDPLWILPNMEACVMKLSRDAKVSTCLVNRMQHERMMRRIAQACIRLIEKIA